MANAMATRRHKRDFRTDAALELSTTERLVWDDDWIALSVHLERQEARLAVAHVPVELIDALRDISIACWRDVEQSRQTSDGEYPGMRSSLVETRQLIHRAIRAVLLNEGTHAIRASLSAEAIEAARLVRDPERLR